MSILFETVAIRKVGTEYCEVKKKKKKENRYSTKKKKKKKEMDVNVR